MNDYALPPKHNVAGTWHHNYFKGKQTDKNQRIQRFKQQTASNSLLLTSRTDQRDLRHAETTRSQENIPNFFKSAFNPEFVWTSPAFDKEESKQPLSPSIRCTHLRKTEKDRTVSCGAECTLALAPAEDRIKVQKAIYKQRNASNLRKQFYCASEPSDNEEVASRCASREARKPGTTELPGMRMSMRYERSRYQKGRSSDLMRFVGEAVISRQLKNEVSDQAISSATDLKTAASYFKVVPAFNATGMNPAQSHSEFD